MSDSTQDTASRDWGNYWQGRTAAGAGAALVGVEQNAEIDAFWASCFANVPHDDALLDLASGAGTVLRSAHAAGLSNLTALDISANALASLAAALPDTAIVVASADAPPFAPESFDVVTSQFGVEYANIEKAAAAVVPLLRKGGKIIWLTHLTGGAIASEVQAKSTAAEAIVASGFTTLARAIFTTNDTAFEAAAAAFRPAQDNVLALAKAGDPLAAHLYSGTQQLYNRRSAYAPSDIAAWYDDMETQLSAYAGRMSGMLGAAIDDTTAKTVEGIWHSTGLTVTPGTTLELGGKPAARILRAQLRPQL